MDSYLISIVATNERADRQRQLDAAKVAILAYVEAHGITDELEHLVVIPAIDAIAIRCTAAAARRIRNVAGVLKVSIDGLTRAQDSEAQPGT